MDKEKLAKLAKIKKNVKAATPAIIALASATALVGIGIYTTKNFSKKITEGIAYNFTLPIITGEEKDMILGSKDTILQHIEDGLYLLTANVTED